MRDRPPAFEAAARSNGLAQIDGRGRRRFRLCRFLAAFVSRVIGVTDELIGVTDE